MLTYLSALFSGSVDPFWPHLVLISGSVLAGIAVGAGIIFESPKYSAHINRAAMWLVIGGVAIESICTVCLFAFDEGVSRGQQEKIIALETRLAPRALSDRGIKEVADKLRPVCFMSTISVGASTDTYEASWFADQLIKVLKLAGCMNATRGIDVNLKYLVGFSARGVVANFTTGNERAEHLSRTLASALKDEGIDASAVSGFRELDMASIKGLTAEDRNTIGADWTVILVGDRF